jgi:hypothetical protein
MLNAFALIIVAALAVAETQSPKPQPPTSCEPTVTVHQNLSRGLPAAFYDQGRESISTIFPKHRLLADRREGRIANINYSLLVFQPVPGEPVKLQALAVDWTRLRAWDLDAACSADRWTDGLIAVLEAIAAIR